MFAQDLPTELASLASNKSSTGEIILRGLPLNSTLNGGSVIDLLPTAHCFPPVFSQNDSRRGDLENTEVKFKFASNQLHYQLPFSLKSSTWTLCQKGKHAQSIYILITFTSF